MKKGVRRVEWGRAVVMREFRGCQAGVDQGDINVF